MRDLKIKKYLTFPLVIAAFLCLGLSTAHAAPSAELVADAETGRILHGQNINSLRHPASLTKVMTLYMTFLALEQGVLRMDQSLPVSWRAAAEPPSRLGLNEGERIKVRDAIYGLVTESANDAAVVLAEAVGGSEERFADMMTERARALGMKRTVYRNANGLPDDEQVTTAFDQAILARAMLYHFPQYYKFFRTRTFTYDGVSHRNHNRLMTRYEGMDGIKTGYIRASGFNLIASAKRNNRRLIGIVFGGRTAKSRDNRVADILDYGFDRLYAEAKSGKRYATLPQTVPAANAAEPSSESSTPIAQGDEDSASPAPLAAMEPAAAPSPAAPSTGAPPAANEPADTAASSPAPSETPRKNGVRKWGVQVGSFTSRKQGLTAIASAKKRAPLLKNAKASIVSTKNGKKTIYRARLNGLDEAAARNACDILTGKGGTCVTVPPKG